MKKINKNNLNRFLTGEIRAVENTTRTFEISISSETPYRRWFGNEILCHDAESVDLSRLQDGGVVLFAHGRDANYGVLPIAKIDSVWIDETERKLRAKVTFDEDEESDKICKKVQNGMLKGVSIGYSVFNWETVSSGGTSLNGRFQGESEIAVKWQPYEISFEPTPADPTVGVGRGIQDNSENGGTITMDKFNNPQANIPSFMDGTKSIPMPNVNPPAPVVPPVSSTEDIIAAERTRVTDINNLCKQFQIESETYIANGNNIDEVRASVLDKLRTANPALPNAKVVVDEADKFRVAAIDSIILRGGVAVENAAEGSSQLRNLSLRELAIQCMKREGKSNVDMLNNDELFSRSLTPDSQFTSILSNTIGKTISTASGILQPSFKLWCGEGSNKDFKPTEHYRMSEAGNLELVTQKGEIKFDETSDEQIKKTLVTYGKSFGFSRQALINDDVGVLTKVPEAYIRAAYRTINSKVYEIIGNNSKIYDAKNLFHADHGNLQTITGLDITSLSLLRKGMRLQKNINGKEILNISPAYLIVPAALETQAQQLIYSLADPSSNNANTYNPFNKSLTIIVEPELDSYSESDYYTASNSAECEHIEITYLNGRKEPVLSSSMDFNSMGVKWNCLFDVGINTVDYRGVQKGKK